MIFKFEFQNYFLFKNRNYLKIENHENAISLKIFSKVILGISFSAIRFTEAI